MPQTPNSASSPEREKPLSEAVKDFIDSAEKRQKESPQVSETVQQVQEGAAEVMAGVEKPKERISERQGESGQKGDLRATAGSAQDEAAQISAAVKDVRLPTTEVMIKKIRTAIAHDIKMEMKRAVKLQKNLNKGSAEEYSTVIARIRTLKEKLASLWDATAEFVKGIYLNYFTPDGKRR